MTLPDTKSETPATLGALADLGNEDIRRAYSRGYYKGYHDARRIIHEKQNLSVVVFEGADDKHCVGFYTPEGVAFAEVCFKDKSTAIDLAERLCTVREFENEIKEEE